MSELCASCGNRPSQKTDIPASAENWAVDVNVVGIVHRGTFSALQASLSKLLIKCRKFDW